MSFLKVTFAMLTGLGMATTASASPEYPLFGDINGDCIVDKADIKPIKLLSAGQKIRLPYDTDLNNDGTTDVYDYYLVLGASNSTCGRRLIGDVNGDGLTDLVLFNTRRDNQPLKILTNTGKLPGTVTGMGTEASRSSSVASSLCSSTLMTLAFSPFDGFLT